MLHALWTLLETFWPLLGVLLASLTYQWVTRAQRASQERREAFLESHLRKPGVILAYRQGDDPRVTVVERLEQPRESGRTAE